MANKTVNGDFPLWDGEEILFGRYPQTLATSIAVITKLKSVPRPKDGGYLSLDGEEYAEIAGKYYRVEPIRWIVLGRKGKEAILLSTYLLDQRIYDERERDFPESSLCAWLNGEFLTKNLGNASCIQDLEGHKVSILSEEERHDAFYLYGYSPDWASRPTDYAKAQGVAYMEAVGSYWLRESESVAEAKYYYVDRGTGSRAKGDSTLGVRPMIRVLLKEEYVEPKATKKKKAVTPSPLPIDIDGNVYYGKYPQSLVIDEEIIAKLRKIRPYGGNPFLELEGKEYAMDGGLYYSVDPIKWIVASLENGKARLVADVVLDAHRLDATLNRYETSDLRMWLIGTFLPRAFEDGAAAFLDLGEDKIEPLGKEHFEDRSLKFPFMCPSSPYGNARSRCKDYLNVACYNTKTPAESNTTEVYYTSVIGGLWHGFSTRSANLCDGFRLYAEANVVPSRVKPTVPLESELVEVVDNKTIVFGEYPQRKVTDPALIKKIEAAKPDARGYREVEGKKYFVQVPFPDEQYYEEDCEGPVKGEKTYFLVEPIQWTVIVRSENEALVYSKKAIDCRPFIGLRDKYDDLSYHTSRIRRYLTQVLAKRAFPDTEPLVPVAGDLATILSYQEQFSEELGLATETGKYSGAYGKDCVVQPCYPTDYAKTLGAKTVYRSHIPAISEPGCRIWTKTVLWEDHGGERVTKIHDVEGDVHDAYYPHATCGLRPCIRLRLHDPVIAECRRKEKEEAERKAAEEAARLAKEEAERLAKEKAEAERLAKEKAEREEAERKQREEAERIAREKEEAERLAKEKAEREEAERKKAEEEAAKKKAKEEFFASLPSAADLYEASNKPHLSSDGRTVLFGVWADRFVPDEFVGDMPKELLFAEHDDCLSAATNQQAFRYYVREPIQWIVLKSEGRRYLILADKVLYPHRFHECYKGKKPMFSGKFACDYAHSEVRKWLDEDFLPYAFPRDEAYQMILETDIDNGVSSAPTAKKEKLLCENTRDMAFLLSEAEFSLVPRERIHTEETGYSNKASRFLPQSMSYVDWWLRTPDTKVNPTGENACYVDPFDEVIKTASVDMPLGVRPAMWIEIK